MGLETGDFLDDLVQANPVTATDSVTQGADHIRLLKKVLQQTFGLMDGLLQFPTNNVFLKQSNVAAAGFINMIKVNASDQVEIGALLVAPSNVLVTNAQPQLAWLETDAAVDNKRWDITVAVGGLFFRATDDAGSAAADFLTVARTAVSIDSVTIGGTTVLTLGRVGIGTLTPDVGSALNVVGGRTFLDSPDNFSLGVRNAGVLGGYIGSAGLDLMVFSFATGVERMRLDAAGNMTLAAGIISGTSLRATGNILPTTGEGLEFAVSGGVCFITPFNRTTVAFLNLNISGGAAAVVFANTGITSFGGATTAAGDITAFA